MCIDHINLIMRLFKGPKYVQTDFATLMVGKKPDRGPQQPARLACAARGPHVMRNVWSYKSACFYLGGGGG